jgi:ribosomal protein L28
MLAPQITSNLSEGERISRRRALINLMKRILISLSGNKKNYEIRPPIREDHEEK